MSSSHYKNLYALISALSDGVKKMEQGKLNPLQVELLLDDARSLHERLAVIQYLSAEKELKSSESSNSKKEKKKTSSISIQFGQVESKEDPVKQIDLEESIDEVLESNEKEIPLKEEAKKPTFGESINDRFAQKESSSLADKLSKQPIADLFSAIGLNEKFLFIEELFAGDSKVYKQQLEVLNSMQSFDEATAHINNKLLKEFGWKLKGSVEKKFIKLIERRYI
ncbi:MAG: hypothetical protein CL853_02165 [Crocinitomicaceae bacterium]|nr:hypothetical protein [Crocinitomicaceae bacterium]|tara:strand:+ start:93 stop:764 length:672 start_codon:yes stop_codon:yes gene_type:complete